MPRVHHVRAAKDYPAHGIEKGEMYYHWSFRYGGKYVSKTPPRPSQLTQSKMSGAYSAQEDLEDAIGGASDPVAIIEALNECAEAIRDVAQEYRDAKEAMPEGLQEGQVAQDCEEKADALEAYADELEAAASEIEGMDASDFVDADARKEEGEEPFKEDDDFEDLNEAERDAYMDQARETAEGPSLDI